MSIKVDTMLFELAKLRESDSQYTFKIATANEALRQTKEYTDLQMLKEAQVQNEAQIILTEKNVREIALSEYAANQVKDFGGVQIKNFTILEYDEQAAVNYCLKHQHAGLLKLDKRGFEKVAKITQPDFVTIKEEPRAQIATDLSEYLEK
jgi:hypothetical protein